MSKTQELRDVLVSAGWLASELGVSLSAIRKYVKLGIIPEGARVDNTTSVGRLVWHRDDIPIIRARVTERKRYAETFDFGRNKKD